MNNSQCILCNSIERKFQFEHWYVSAAFNRSRNVKTYRFVCYRFTACHTEFLVNSIINFCVRLKIFSGKWSSKWFSHSKWTNWERNVFFYFPVQTKWNGYSCGFYRTNCCGSCKKSYSLEYFESIWFLQLRLIRYLQSYARIRSENYPNYAEPSLTSFFMVFQMKCIIGFYVPKPSGKFPKRLRHSCASH